jgi:hypothetical protein
MTETINTRVIRLENALAILAERQAQFDQALQRLDNVLVVLITAQTKMADVQVQDRVETRDCELRLSERIAELATISCNALHPGDRGASLGVGSREHDYRQTGTGPAGH